MSDNVGRRIGLYRSILAGELGAVSELKFQPNVKLPTRLLACRVAIWSE